MANGCRKCGGDLKKNPIRRKKRNQFHCSLSTLRHQLNKTWQSLERAFKPQGLGKRNKTSQSRAGRAGARKLPKIRAKRQRRRKIANKSKAQVQKMLCLPGPEDQHIMDDVTRGSQSTESIMEQQSLMPACKQFKLQANITFGQDQALPRKCIGVLIDLNSLFSESSSSVLAEQDK